MRFLVVVSLILPLHVSLAQRRDPGPDFATIQYAGSIGYFSAGIGYNVLKKHSLSLHYGHVPKSRGGQLNILASKLLFKVRPVRISNAIILNPVEPGIMLSYHLGEEFNSRWPGHRYPDGYYWWKSSLRSHIVSQTSITIKLPGASVQSMTFFVEFNTNELYLISLIQNRHSLKLTDIVKVGYGVIGRF